MADIDTPTPDPAKVTPSPEAEKAPVADKAAADKLAADAATKDAEREAEVDRRAAAKAEKLAGKKADEIVAAREAAAKTKAEREKLDALEAAKLEKADLQTELDKLRADAKASATKAELAQAMVVGDFKPANPAAMGYIAAAYQRNLDAGMDADKALAAVRKDEAFLFAQPAAPATQQTQTQAAKANTGGTAAGGTEREAPAGDPKTRQYSTKPPSEIDPKDTAALQASILERHGFRLPLSN
ncbi:MAG: hypothetical protein ACEQSX_17265 [Baekduiaceae bacterium]